MAPPAVHPLIGLVEDTLLVGETRVFVRPTLAPRAAQGVVAGQKVALVAIANAVELPSFVRARWATLAEVVAAEPERLEVRGLARARIAAARGGESPYSAELVVEPSESASLEPAARVALAALAHGARSTRTGAEDELRAALTALIRALADADLHRQLEGLPLAEAVEKLARLSVAREPGERAADDLERMMAELAAAPELPVGLRHRLWSECVALMRRLDVYDPAAGTDADDVGQLKRRLMQAGLPPAAKEVAKRELRLLASMKSDHHDYSTYWSHLELMARLPWHPDPLPPVDLVAVAAALDRDHFGLEKPKKRILEYLAVRALGGRGGATILCLVGPPGVGKTSIVASIAEALGRKLVRVALGGVHDESELRGHRKTFTAATAGRVISGLARAGSASAVVLLDELDKVGSDRQRSPVGALHEILDPEQNAHFYDNYLATPYDLSNVMFVCTANDLDAIAPTLRDRLEVVQLEGYTPSEKRAIAERYLARKLAEDHGLPAPLTFAEGVLDRLIDGYTAEPGVRELQRVMARVHRDRAVSTYHARQAGQPPPAAPVDQAELDRVLGARRHLREPVPDVLPVGVSMGLAVSGEGGSVLYLEVGSMPGRGEVRLTGRVGEVMRESAHAALTHLRTHAERYGIEAAALERDFHVHVPEGAVPKDGPSAGVALVLALLSAVRGTPLPGGLVSTGEITLSGRVLPVGGVRAKLLAAERAGARRAVVPRACQADVPAELTLEVTYVERVEEVVAAALGERARTVSSGEGACSTSIHTT